MLCAVCESLRILRNKRDFLQSKDKQPAEEEDSQVDEVEEETEQPTPIVDYKFTNTVCLV